MWVAAHMSSHSGMRFARKALLSHSYVIRSVFFGLPRRRVPSGCQRRSTFGCLWSGMRRMCPRYRHLRCHATVAISGWPVWVRISSLLTLSLQLILRIRWRQLFSKAVRRFSCSAVSSRHSHSVTQDRQYIALEQPEFQLQRVYGGFPDW